MRVRVLGFGVGGQVGGFGGPVGVLPDDEGFVEGVEAVAAAGGAVDGEGFLVAFGVCEVQGQGVGDAPVCCEGPDHFVDEVGGHGFVLVGEDEVHVSAASFSDQCRPFRDCGGRRAGGVVCLPFGLAAPIAANEDTINSFVCD